MNKLIFLIAGVFCCAGLCFSQNNPVADPQAVVVSGNMRFTVLTPEMIRIEHSDRGIFEDHASFVAINRRLPVPKYKVKEKGGILTLTTDKLTLRYKVGTSPGTKESPNPENLTISFDLNGEEVTWYPWKEDDQNLKGTMRTLDRADGDARDKLEDGLISRSGWAVIDEMAPRRDGSYSLLFDDDEEMPWVLQREDKNAMDIYFLGYGHDYKKALGDFIKISGRIPMPPMYAFGYWYSKYQKYSQQDFIDIVNDVETNGVPLDVMVIDMDWHLPGWTGWTWNRELIPDPEGLLKFMHDHNLKTTLNLHPADGVKTHEEGHKRLAESLGLPEDQDIPWNIENKEFYKAFFKDIIRPLEGMGVDFWWLDWQQWLIARNCEGLGNTFWLNHVFFTDKKNQGTGRPMIYHRWGGLGNHRYQIGFSGDAHTNFESLAFQPYFTSTASNVGYGYWSHDIGGHNQRGPNNPELYLRWIQYGVFTPILRTHSAKFEHIERRIWKYPNFELMKQAIELRYALVPYIYTQARVAYDTGISLCRPLYYEWPEVENAYTNENEYMFGEDILVAPIVEAADSLTGISTKHIWLPKGNWYDVTHGGMLAGDKSYTMTFGQDEIPYFFREGAVIPFYPPLKNLKTRPESLIVKFVPGREGRLRFYEDENDNDNYIDGAYTFTTITQSRKGSRGVYTIDPVEGSFENMPLKRNYVFEILDVQTPQSVAVNGETSLRGDQNDDSHSWSYDQENKVLRIFMPDIGCHDRTKVKVKY